MPAPRLHVGYDVGRSGMYLRVEGADVAAFMSSPTWRAWLFYPASATVGTEGDRILLDASMGLRACQDMCDAVCEADGHGVEVVIDSSFAEYANAQETYIKERSHVGMAIKAQGIKGIAGDAELGPRFCEFRSVVDAAMVRSLRERQMLDAFS